MAWLRSAAAAAHVGISVSRLNDLRRAGHLASLIGVTTKQARELLHLLEAEGQIHQVTKGRWLYGEASP